MQPPTHLSGIVPAVLTMFRPDGSLDTDSTSAHVDDLVARGADGIVAAGTTGEFVGLSEQERAELIRAAVDGAAGRVPVIAGTGAYSTCETLRHCDRAAEAGAAAALVILPYYMVPNRAEVVGHFREVGRNSSLPVLVYNNSRNSGTDAMSAVDIGQLYEEGLVAGVKSTFPTVHQVHEVRATTDPDFQLFYGSFMAPLEGLAGGADGWISGILNVVLEEALALRAAISRSDLDAARQAWARILPYKLLYTRALDGRASDIAIWRHILERRGGHGGSSRAPLLPLTEEQSAIVDRTLLSLDDSALTVR